MIAISAPNRRNALILFFVVLLGLAILAPINSVTTTGISTSPSNQVSESARGCGETERQVYFVQSTGALEQGGQPELALRFDLTVPLARYVAEHEHELAFPFEVMSSIVRALKPGGQLVFVEYRAEDPKVPIKALHKMSEAQIKREAAVHALVWDRTVGTLPWQHFVVFRKRN